MKKVPLIGLLVFLFLLSACNFAAAEAPDGVAVPQSDDLVFTQAAQTIVAGITQTAEAAPPPTQAPPPPPSPEPVQADAGVQDAPPADQAPPAEQPPTETPTPTPSPTPSETVPSQPQITANVSTNCRFGPDPGFEILGYLLEGETSEVHGKDRHGWWWYIANPDVPGGFCWVWTETTTVVGDVDSLAFIDPPPTYTPTPTDTQTPTPTATATATTDGYP